MHLNGLFGKSEMIVLQCKFGHFWRWNLLDLISRKDQIKLGPIQERSNGLAGFKTSKDKLSHEDGSKTRRTIQN
jgi:hypothetical protein